MIFFLFAVSILASAYGYIGWRIITPSGWSAAFRAVSWSVMGLFLVLPFLSITLRLRGISGFSVDMLSWAAYLSMGFISLVFVMLVLRDFPLLIAAIAKKGTALGGMLLGRGNIHPDPVNPGRHQFLVHSLNMGILALAGALTAYGVFQARRRPRVVEVTLPVKGLPNGLEGLRMVQITDIHVGPTVKRDYVQAIVDEVNRLRPDAVFLTGDLVDGTVDNLRDDVAPLAEIKATYGSFFVTGNHEYYSGVNSWMEEIMRLGFTVLHNDHVVIPHGDSRVLLSGVPDFNGGQFHRDHISDPAAAIEDAPKHDVSILLAHQPRSVFEAAKAGFDIMISGHTHGGQYVPWNYFVGLQQPYTLGLHRHGNTWVYVSRGTGYWGPPLRIGIPNEITLFSLSRQA